MPPLALGLAGGRRAVPQLLAALRKPGEHGEIIGALGLLGDLSAVRPLVELLSVELVAGAAADALHVITGAALFEDAIVEEQMTEAELFPEGLDDFVNRDRGRAVRMDNRSAGGTSPVSRCVSVARVVDGQRLPFCRRAAVSGRHTLCAGGAASVSEVGLLSEVLPRLGR